MFHRRSVEEDPGWVVIMPAFAHNTTASIFWLERNPFFEVSAFLVYVNAFETFLDNGTFDFGS